MKIAQSLVFNTKLPIDEQIRILNVQLRNIFTAVQGRLRFGTGDDGDRGENIQGRFQEFTTSATPDAENTIVHGAGATPKGFLIMWQDKAGSLYQGPTTGTNWDATNMYLKCDVASVTFNIFVLI